MNVRIYTPELKAGFDQVWSGLPRQVRTELEAKLHFVFEADHLVHNRKRTWAQARKVSGGLWEIYLNRSAFDGAYNAEFVRGLIAHELAHVYLDHASWDYLEHEREANKQARAWGFPHPVHEKEIFDETQKTIQELYG